MINLNTLSAIKENYYFNNNMKETSFKDYLESESENDPNFFFELFGNEEYEQNWGASLTEEDRREWENLLDKADEIWLKMISDEEQEQRCRLSIFFNNLFAEKDINEAKTVIQTLPSYKEFCQNNTSDVDTDYIDEEEYKEIVKETITEYIKKNDIEVEIKELNDTDVVEDGDNSFTYKGEEYQGFDSSDGGDFDCTSCENFDLIYEAVQDSDCEDKEELTMFLCGMNFVYKKMVDDVMYKFYFK